MIRYSEALRVFWARLAGNQIIHKLQNDGKALKSKLRLKAAVMLQQQEHAAQKQAELDASERGNAELRTQAAELKGDKERSEEAHAACKQQLSEAQDLLRSNQQAGALVLWLSSLDRTRATRSPATRARYQG